jgi:hypothetical protein
MITSPVIKFLVIAIFVMIAASLATAFFHLARDRGASDKTVRALSVRIALSIALFIFLMILYATGVVGPNR